MVYCISCLAEDKKYNEDVVIWDGYSLCIKHANEYERIRKTSLIKEMIKLRDG